MFRRGGSVCIESRSSKERMPEVRERPVAWKIARERHACVWDSAWFVLVNNGPKVESTRTVEQAHAERIPRQTVQVLVEQPGKGRDSCYERQDKAECGAGHAGSANGRTKGLKTPDEAGSDSSSSSSQSGARQSSHEEPGGVSTPSSLLASSTPSQGAAGDGVMEEMDIEARRGEKRSEPEPSADEEEKRGEKRPMPEAMNTPLNAPPLYAGSSSPPKTSRVSTVKVADAEYYVLDEHLEEEWGDMEKWGIWSEEEEEEESLDWGKLWHSRTENEGPPELSEHEMEQVDAESRKTEVNRLLDMGVLEQVASLPEAAELLQTKHVMDWRYREAKWKRRARLVCKQLKFWDPNRTDVYAPSTNPSIAKLLPALMVSRAGWQMVSFDVKDAFLEVKQLYVMLDGSPYRVHRCLPGQQAASARWGEQLAADLATAGLVPDEACPAAFGQPGLGATVHVDDGLLAGTPESTRKVTEILERKYKLEVSEPVKNIGDSLKFLKKELIITESGIEVRVDKKYLEKICGVLDLKRGILRKTPCSPEIAQMDESEPLQDLEASKFRAAVGSFLYLSPDRPDARWTIAHLARSMSRPTKRMWKHACHLAEYLLATADACLTRWHGRIREGQV